MSTEEKIITKAPPPPPMPTKDLINENESKSNNFSNFIPNEVLWAKDYPELQRACYFAKVALHKRPAACKFKDITGVLQQGPTCGLVALTMIFNSKITAAELLEQAKSYNFTNNGEMFSCNNLHKLLRLNEHYLEEKIETYCYIGKLNCDVIRDELKNGSVLLVAYDSDVTHAPANLNGHKAHWALIIGYLITENDEFYVLARHGKARNLAIWSLKSLSDSNANLTEFAQPKEHPNEVFLLPDGGIAGENGLCEKCIVIKRLQYKDIIF